MSLAPQIISAAPGTPAGTVQTIADIQRKINALATQAGNMHPASITADRLVANSITAAQIQVGSITGDAAGPGTGSIAGTTIVGGNIQTGSVNADKIIAGTITATQINTTYFNANGLSAIAANLGSVTSGSLSVGSGACVISDAAGIVILQGTTGVHNITWLTASATVGSTLSSNTTGGTSSLIHQSLSPDGTKIANIQTFTGNGTAFNAQEVLANIGSAAGGGPQAVVLASDGTGKSFAQWPHGIGMFGVIPPSAKPATPTTVAQVAAILSGYGMCV